MVTRLILGGRCVWIVLMVLGLAGCHSKPKQLPFAGQIGEAHGLETWQSNTAIEGDLHIEFADPGTTGARVLDAHFIYETSGKRVKMKLADEKNTTLLFDGQTIWVSPSSSPIQQPRVTLTLWPFLMAAPFRLQEPGVQVGEAAPRQFGSQTFTAAQVTFAPSSPGIPGDWFTIFADPKTHRLQAMAYGRNDDTIQKPLAVTYYDFKQASTAVFATEWKFWNWNKEVGIYGLPIGTGRIYNLEFVEPTKKTFVKPADAREVDPSPR